MNTPLRVLIVDDSENDTLLLLHELRRGGYQPAHHRVENAKQMHQALVNGPWDLVITDHNMPQFDSAAAIEMIKTNRLDIPIIIVSGTIGEETAVQAMKSGAHDYIMKDNLARLAPAITRELVEAETRRARRRAEAAVIHMALHDALTGLSNRREFERQLKQALHSARQRELQHGLLYLDLDQFKLINDTCGHIAGDNMLQQLAGLLRTKIRNNDTLARLGGDEFGILLDSCDLDHAYRIAENIRQSIQNFRFSWHGAAFTIGVSIGIVMITAASKGTNTVLSAADVACYAAKDKGRNRIQIYERSDIELARRYGEMQWVTRIKEALQQNRFVLYQQLILPLTEDTALPSGYEFLLRMLDEHNKIIPPNAFIPAAERYNLMPMLDRWVIQAVFSHIAELAEGCSNSAKTTLSFVNLSGSSLSDSTFFDFIREQILTHSIDPSRVCFEITETAAIANLDSAVNFITTIKEQGCHFALDDFGTGLCSFSYLKTLPVDYLKIDGEFIKNIVQIPMDCAIVEAINRIGCITHIKTIAEHVETIAVREKLKEIGVNYVQGYGVERPQAVASAAQR